MSNTLQQLEIKYKELGKQINELKKESQQNFGFEDDSMFLLSNEEYEQYKDQIPQINCWWWLRSPGDNSNLAASVYNDGYVYSYGNYVLSTCDAVRPALKLKSIDSRFYNKTRDGRGIIYCGVTWECIDEEKEYYIAEMPIAFRRFDNKSNDYVLSEIRKFLYNWEQTRR